MNYRLLRKSLRCLFLGGALYSASSYAEAPIGHFNSGVGEGAAEIIAFDKNSNSFFVTNAETNSIDIVDASDPTNLTLTTSLDLAPYGDGVNSVASYNGNIAVAVQADPKQDAGKIVVFSATGTFLKEYPAGALPDMVTFSPNGKYIIAANEGEPNDDFTNDPEGSITVINVESGIGSGVVTQINFQSFNDKLETLRNAGVKLYTPGATVAQDLEPEYIAVSKDSKTAFVGCQENNAVVVLDLETLTIKEIQPLGLKDHSKDLPQIINCPLPKMPILGKTDAGQKIRLGGFSGLRYEKTLPNGHLVFLAHPDRGPNGEPTDADNDGVKDRPFPLPDFQPSIYRINLNPNNGKIRLMSRTRLWRYGAERKFLWWTYKPIVPMTGLPNMQAADAGTAFTDEIGVDLYGNKLKNDPFGADMEGIAIAEDGSYWMCDEYRPAIYHFNKWGILLDRFVPEGSANAAGKAQGYFGSEYLPEVYASRRKNRGFEAIAIQDGKVFAFMQSPLDNPDVSDAEASAENKKSDYNSINSQVIRILEFDMTTKTVTGEYAYLLEGAAGVDKLGDADSLGDGRFIVIERDSSTEENARKFIFEIDLRFATNLLELSDDIRGVDGTLEGLGAEGLVAQNIKPVIKRKVLNLPSLGYHAGDKPEGLAVIDENTWAVINDNDFGLLDEPVPYDGTVPLNPEPTQTILGIISFQQSNEMDTSNKDDGINFRYANVFGMYQPDSMASIDIDGKTYYLTANEGDARDYDAYSEEARVKDFTLDESFAENATEDEELGRLKITTELGNFDDDPELERIYTYGARSFSIRDENGGLVFDSGDMIAKTIAARTPELFNADYDGEEFEVDGRSDDKGTEPEALTTGEIDGKKYAFVGLERAGGGIMIFDISNPKETTFINYIRDDRDISPEGLVFIPAADSPNGKPLLGVANEVSGTVSVYQIDDSVLK